MHIPQPIQADGMLPTVLPGMSEACCSPLPLSPCEDRIKGRPSVDKAGGQLSPEPCYLGSLNSDFQPPELEETIVESPLVYGRSVTGNN